MLHIAKLSPALVVCKAYVISALPIKREEILISTEPERQLEDKVSCVTRQRDTNADNSMSTRRT